jgi:hypothetical protein
MRRGNKKFKTITNIMKHLKRNRTSKRRLKKDFSNNQLIQPSSKLSISTMDKIHRWEKDSNPDVIRSSFNRELYYKYLKAIS